MSGLETLYDHVLLTPDQMFAAEKAAFDVGVSPDELMENAGRAVAEVTADALGTPFLCEGEVVVLAGPGQNGGDGFVAARLLRDWGYKVRLILLGQLEQLTGSAKGMAAKWGGPYGPVDLGRIRDAVVVIDALFGIGLSRPLDGDAALLVDSANQCSGLKIAVDVPSGLDVTTGNTSGPCFTADVTVTFAQRKPGQLVAPGRFYCGGIDGLVVSDIGLELNHILDQEPKFFQNEPLLWGHVYPHPGPSTHKYDRGSMVVLGGREPTLGASRLASLAALRAGAGLVTLAAPSETYDIQAGALTDILVRRFEQELGFDSILRDPKLSAIVMGPGMGLGDKSVKLIETALARDVPLVLDADALSLISSRLAFFGGKLENAILTPHDGEFKRLFPNLDIEADRFTAVQYAADQLGAIVVLKGVSTLIAEPDGRIAVTTNAPSSLSVAGTGDVLAGIIGGLLAQDMPLFEAACAGVWLHGEAANHLGKGMIASDLLTSLPRVLL